MLTLRPFPIAASLVLLACGGKNDEQPPERDPAADVPVPAVVMTSGAAPKTASKSAQAAALADRPIAPPPKEPVHYESYSKALLDGRAFMKAGDSQKAKQAFEAAITEKADSATAYSELSWLAFTMKDLATAKLAARKSIAFGSALPIVQAMSHYNLGRVFEEEGDATQAATNYTASYTLRQNKVVGERLAALGRPLPSSVWGATPLKGPYTTLEQYCEPFKLSDEGASGTDRGTCETSVEKLEALELGIPWLMEVGTFALFDYENDNEPGVNLAFKTAKGWYVRERFELQLNRYRWNIETADVVGERLVLYHSNEQGRFDAQLYRFVTICGVGASGAPSCLGPVQLYDSYTGYQGSKEHGEQLQEKVSMHCSAGLAKSDVLTIAAAGKGCKTQPGLVGAHQLQFP